MSQSLNTKGSKLFRSWSLRSVNEAKEEHLDSRSSSSSLWRPNRWHISTLSGRGMRSTATLSTQHERDTEDDARSSTPIPSNPTSYLPRIRPVSPIALSDVCEVVSERPENDPPPICTSNDATTKRGDVRRSDSWTVVSEIHQDASMSSLSSTNTKHKFTLVPSSADDIEDYSGDEEESLRRERDPQAYINALVETPRSSVSSLALALHFQPPSQDDPPPSSIPPTSQHMTPTITTSRPVLTRRAGDTTVSRRYTFAMAMNDEGITDEALVKELERIRALAASNSQRPMSDPGHLNLEDVWDIDEEYSRMELDAGMESNVPSRVQFFHEAGVPLCDSPVSEGGSEGVLNPSARHPSPSSSLPRPISEPTSQLSWHTTRHALLTCRELVRTERHYLLSLQRLLSGETASAPSPLMLHYTAVIVGASKTFVEKLERNPTPGGVAKAFVSMEVEMEAAYVGWCGVVGAWFADVEQTKGLFDSKAKTLHRTALRRSRKRSGGDDGSGTKKPVSSWKGAAIPASDAPTQVIAIAPNSMGFLVPSTTLPTPSSPDSSPSSSSSSEFSASGCIISSHSAVTSAVTSPSTSKSNTAASSPTMAFAGAFSSRTRESSQSKAKTVSEPPSRANSFIGQMRFDQLSTQLERSPVTTSSKSKSSRKLPPLRDLAILPTQRVMRYVLLFRDLQSSTSVTSQSRVVIEKAAELAGRIAKKCDRAQTNAAFIVHPTATPNTDKDMPVLDSRSCSSSSSSSTSSSGKGQNSKPQKTKKDVKRKEEPKGTQTMSKKLAKSKLDKKTHLKQHSETLPPVRKSLADDEAHERSKDADCESMSSHEPSGSVVSPDDAAKGKEKATAQQDSRESSNRRRSQSYTTPMCTPTYEQPIPRSTSSQRLSMLNLSVAIGGLWGRSSSQQQSREKGVRNHKAPPPSAFSPLRTQLSASMEATIPA